MPIGAFRLNTLSAAMAVPAYSTLVATGGTIGYSWNATDSKLYKLHRFTTAGSNTLTVTTAGTANYILVAAGGGGGGNYAGRGTGGGGGAGEVLLRTNQLLGVQSHSLTVGTGGTGAAGSSSSATGSTGGSTTGFSTTAVGGSGGGTTQVAGATATAGAGSGGGGGGGTNFGGTWQAGPYSAGSVSTGFSGGTGRGGTTSAVNGSSGGGGGGATAAGSNASTSPITTGAAGGAGYAYFGTTYSVGGQGGWGRAGDGEQMGSTNTAPGSGGGGAGGAIGGSAVNGATGRNGSVVVAYPVSTNPLELVENAEVIASTTTIGIPSFAVAGDIALLYDYSTTTTDTTPSGFTQITTATTTGIRLSVSYKVLVGGEASTNITGMGGTTRKILKLFRPNQAGAPLSILNINSEATTATPATQTLTLTNSTGFALYATAVYATTGTAVTTRNGTFTFETSSTTRLYQKAVKYTNNQTPTNITNISMSDNGTNALISFYLRLG